MSATTPKTAPETTLLDHPLAQFKADRQRARNAADPMANLCVVANATSAESSGAAPVELRTLVLRDVEDDLAIFINAHSPKWAHLQNTCSVLAYWPSIQVQFRIQANTRPVAARTVADSWQLRPDMPKRMDWFYGSEIPQSQSIGNRKDLLARVQQLSLPDPLIAPDSARGLLLQFEMAERLDLNQANGLHDRVRYSKAATGWQQDTLVP